MPLPPQAPAPAATALDLRGAPVRLDALTGSGAPAVLFFYKSDCPTSAIGARALPRFAELPGLAVAAISQDDAASAAGFAADVGLGAPIRLLVDPAPWAASNALGVKVTPTWFLVAGGVVEATHEGWSRDGANALAERAASLIGIPPRAVSWDGDGLPKLQPG